MERCLTLGVSFLLLASAPSAHLVLGMGGLPYMGKTMISWMGGKIKQTGAMRDFLPLIKQPGDYKTRRSLQLSIFIVSWDYIPFQLFFTNVRLFY